MQTLSDPLEIDFALPGVRPARQQRSRQMTATLLAAGPELLRTRSLDALSIDELCASIGATVGAFYSRFQSKEAYFNALQVVANKRGTARAGTLAESDAMQSGDLGAMCRVIAAAVVAWFVENEGVVRASLQHPAAHEERWGVFKQLGRELVDISSKRLLPAMGGGSRPAKQRAIGFAYQVLFGTLINTVLNDPGPCRLRDRDMAARMGQLFATVLVPEHRARAKTR